jgi:hypothetical protein
MNDVWVFNGEGGTFPAGVFATRGEAEAWITANKLTGCLTRYPVGTSLYDWAIANGHWSPRKDYQREAKFIQRFSSAYLEHYHFTDGE